MTHQICKIVTLFALVLQLALPIQTQLEPALAPVEETAQNNDASYYPPFPNGDGMFPESTSYPLDDMGSELEGHHQYPPSPSAYSPGIEQDYPYNGAYPSPSPSPAPYIDVMAPEVDDYGVPSEASMATPPTADWEYSAEDDAGFLSDEAEDEEEEGYDGKEENKRGTMGFVVGAVCLVGLGGLVYRRRKSNQNKRKHALYLQLSRTGDV